MRQLDYRCLELHCYQSFTTIFNRKYYFSYNIFLFASNTYHIKRQNNNVTNIQQTMKIFSIVHSNINILFLGMICLLDYLFGSSVRLLYHSIASDPVWKHHMDSYCFMIKIDFCCYNETITYAKSSVLHFRLLMQLCQK